MTAIGSGDLAVVLRDAGLKVTGPRVAILGSLLGDRTHPTAEEIHARLREELPSLSLSTVYSTLETLIVVGLCRRVRSEGSRIRVDGISSAHDHAVCVECGTIFDIDRGVVRLPPPPATLPGGLEVTSVRVEYDVICASCRSGVQGAMAAPSAAAPSQSKKPKGGQNG